MGVSSFLCFVRYFIANGDSSVCFSVLDKVEREIQVAIQEWETTHQQPFLVNDARYLDAIESQWDSHEQKKEAEKAKRVSSLIYIIFSWC